MISWKRGFCKPALTMAAREKKMQRNSAREYTALEHLVAIFTMFLAKVLMQIKARSQL